MASGQFLGKFRGTVTNNVDPQQLGRVQVSVPSVLGAPAFALPCFLPGLFALPQVGDNVWVEFEGGDPGFPIWTGCFFGAAADVPAGAGAAFTGGAVILANAQGASVVLVGPTVNANNGGLSVS